MIKIMESLKTLFLILTISVFAGFNAMAQSPGGDPPFPFNVTGSGSYSSGGLGLPVGLSGSEVGVSYTLYKGAVAQTPTVNGTGNAISFGNQLAGTYTVVGTSQTNLGATDMLGSAVITENSVKQLTLKVYLEGLWNGTGMNKCKKWDVGLSDFADAFNGTVVDTISVELHDATTYSTIAYQFHSLELNQDGTVKSPGKAYIEIPSAVTGSYYITIKTRNHLETTSANPVSFNSSSIDYDFTDASGKAYVDPNAPFTSMKNLNGKWCLYVGDVLPSADYPQIDSNDMMTVRSNYSDDTTLFGYTRYDLNGDGYVDSLDLMLASQNNNLSIYFFK
jgi:hypothetical protein